MAKTDATWIEIDPASLDDKAKVTYQAYKDMYRQAKEARAMFEEAMSEAANVPKGMRMVFGYNFGKLSVAIVEDDRKAKKAASSKMSLSEYIAMQKALGVRT